MFLLKPKNICLRFKQLKKNMPSFINFHLNRLHTFTPSLLTSLKTSLFPLPTFIFTFTLCSICFPLFPYFDLNILFQTLILSTPLSLKLSTSGFLLALLVALGSYQKLPFGSKISSSLKISLTWTNFLR